MSGQLRESALSTWSWGTRQQVSGEGCAVAGLDMGTVVLLAFMRQSYPTSRHVEREEPGWDVLALTGFWAHEPHLIDCTSSERHQPGGEHTGVSHRLFGPLTF